MQKSQTIEHKPQEAVQIKSVEFGKPLADEAKFTTEQQRELDEF